jgi:hypothetical protein
MAVCDDDAEMMLVAEGDCPAAIAVSASALASNEAVRNNNDSICEAGPTAAGIDVSHGDGASVTIAATATMTSTMTCDNNNGATKVEEEGGAASMIIAA